MFKTELSTVFVILGLGFFLSVSSQDQIVTISNDTIPCKINRVSSNAIYFTQFTGEVKTKSSIRRNDVKAWQIFEPESTQAESGGGVFRTEKWRIAVNGGGGYRIASTKETREQLQNQRISDAEINSYLRQVKTGVKASGQVHYMVWENYGLGIDYQFHNSSGSLHGTVEPGDTYTFIYGKFSDDIFTNYVGLSLYMQYPFSPRFKFFGQISSGLTLFREESVIIYSPMLITGKAYGGNTELGLEYSLAKNFSVAISAGLFQSTISKIKVNNGIKTQEIKLEKEQMEGLSRIDLGVGLKFYL